MAAKAGEGLKTKTISNHLNFAHGLFGFAVKRGGPRPTRSRTSTGRGYRAPTPTSATWTATEVEALLRAVPDDRLGPTDRALYLTATMAGLRQGELLALRWQDVDWTAGLIRVRRSYTRGQFGTPKSRRSSRAVPMADRLAGELERHFQRSALPGRRRPRLRPSRHRPSLRRLEDAQAVQGRAQGRGGAPGALP